MYYTLLGRRRDASAAGGSLAQALLDVPRAGNRVVIFPSDPLDFDIANRTFCELAALALRALRQRLRRRVVTRGWKTDWGEDDKTGWVKKLHVDHLPPRFAIDERGRKRTFATVFIHYLGQPPVA